MPTLQPVGLCKTIKGSCGSVLWIECDAKFTPPAMETLRTSDSNRLDSDILGESSGLEAGWVGSRAVLSRIVNCYRVAHWSRLHHPIEQRLMLGEASGNTQRGSAVGWS